MAVPLAPPLNPAADTAGAVAGISRPGRFGANGNPGISVGLSRAGSRFDFVGAGDRSKLRRHLLLTAALGRRTLIILIDDLDRCRPDQIAEVLEAINFLTDADGRFVAFGFARPQVLAGIGLANRQIAAELAGAEDTPETREAALSG
jgi:hypothetical protein